MGLALVGCKTDDEEYTNYELSQGEYDKLAGVWKGPFGYTQTIPMGGTDYVTQVQYEYTFTFNADRTAKIESISTWTTNGETTGPTEAPPIECYYVLWHLMNGHSIIVFHNDKENKEYHISPYEDPFIFDGYYTISADNTQLIVDVDSTGEGGGASYVYGTFTRQP
ncbi:hypothetical protein FACS189483_10400 [Spirochaetia bacterium]|nr:hypothetical protein FACS189483_10400 [Spirochaetia bacterium]